MYIKKMTASFGRLQNATLEIEEGLNLIEAPNEGGKSTWSAFVRAMLYGVPTKERDKQGFIAEKNRYLPWSGAPMEGTIDLVWRGREITLRRSAKSPSNPFGRFEAVDAATGEKLTSLTGENAGELLLGVPREVFERSAFVGQGAAAVDGAPALEKRIAALVSSGEEDVSSTEARNRLKDWLNRRRHNHTGIIPKLEEARAALDETLERQAKAHRMAEEARREVEALVEEKGELEAALAACRSAENEARRRQYDEAQAALAEAEQTVQAIRADLNRDGPPPDREVLRKAQEDLSGLNTLAAALRQGESAQADAAQAAAEARSAAQDPVFHGLSPEEAWTKARNDADLLLSPQKIGLTVFGAVLNLLGAAGFACVGLFGPWPNREIAFLPAAVFAVAGGVFLLRLRGVLHDRRAEAEAIRSHYGTEDTDDILARAVAYREKWTKAEEAERAQAALTQSLAETSAQRDALKRRLLALVHTFAPTVTDTFGISAALSRALSLGEKLSSAEIRLEGARKLAESLPKPDAVTLGRAGAVPDALADKSPRELAMRLSAVEQELVRRNSVLAMARGELNTLGDPARFQAKREACQEELNRRYVEYDALSLALECLEEADRDLQARFSPALNQRSGQIMSALTGGKYGAITLTRDFEATAEETGALLPRRALTLSRGTADQLYLAVRLAVCELALPGEDPAPLILDDALASFDDARMGLALDYLLSCAENRQILLFTCHSREGAFLEGKRVHRAALQSERDAVIIG